MVGSRRNGVPLLICSSRTTARWKSNVTRKKRRTLPPMMPLCSKPEVSLIGAMSSTAADRFWCLYVPRRTCGSRSSCTSSEMPAAPYTRRRVGWTKRDRSSRSVRAVATTEMVAPVSTMKLSGAVTPSMLTALDQKPEEVARMGSSKTPGGSGGGGGDGASVCGGGGQPAARHGPDAQLLRRRGRDDAHAGACVHDEAERLLAAVDIDVEDRPVVRRLERHSGLRRAARLVQVALGAEVAEEVYEAADAG